MQIRKYFRVLAFVFVAVLTLTALTVLPHAETTNSSAYDAKTETAPSTDTATNEKNTIGLDDAKVASDGTDEAADSEDTSEQANTEGEAQPNQYIYEDDTIIVTAVLADNTLLPAYSQFCVTPVTEETDSIAYQEVEDKIAEDLKEQNQVVSGFLAYDICFIADGVEYEPEDGTVTVTIQYKNDLLNQAVVDSAEEVKMLHLKEADNGVEVEDLTEHTSISTVSETITTDTQTTSATTSPETKTVNSTVQFVTDSFSTFAITGVATGATPSVAVNMQFLTTAGVVDTGVNGTYYLYINRSGYRYTMELNVAAGVATATLDGLYDQNGNKQNDNQGSLYPLTNANYTAILFSYSGSNTITPNGFRWDENNYATQGYTKYETGSTINETYTLTTLSSNVTIANNTGTFTIKATEKAGTKYSSTQLLGALAPVQPYGVFTNYLDLISDMEGNIAAEQATLFANFGNSDNNRNNSISSPIHNFIINKTYAGSTPKTFTFGLYKNATRMDTATITLPTETGETTGSATFTVHDSADNYTVAELNADGNPMNIGDENDGYTLTSVDSSTISSSSAFSSTSYIETINLSTHTAALRNGTTTLKNNLVVGPNYKVTTGNNNTIKLKKGNLLYMTADQRYCSIQAKNGTFPIDFKATMNDMRALSTSLATAVTSNTVMVRTMTIAELNNQNNNGLTFNTNGKMLILNIDATNSPYFISLYANAKFVVNGVSCGGYSPQAGNIIVNIYTKYGNNYYPFAGAIYDAGFVMGTLLAPNADVNSLSQSYNGTIVANYICNCGGEIHGNTISSGTIDTVYDFVNTEIPDDTNYNIPETGGRGNYLFYGAGFALLTTSATGLFCHRRRDKKRTPPGKEK